MTQILVPTLGESVTEATVSKWLKKEGEAVAADEPICELETDKVTLEVNAPAAGVIAKISFGEGSNVGVGAVLGEISAGSGAAAAKAPEKANDSKAPAAPAAPAAEKLAPAVQKMVGDNNLNPAAIAGTGKDGRVTKGDVIAHMEAPKPPAAPVAPVLPRAIGPREERVKMTRLRQKIAERLKEAQNTAAMLTTFNEIDMSAVIEMRNAYKDQFEKKHGVKLGFMSFFVKAAVSALREIPAVNAEINGDDIIYKNYYDISVAVSTPQGLVVPVVKDCDVKSMAQIEKDIAGLGARAKDGKITVDEMTGGTFTITNGGVFGSLMSTPIINPPQVAILGMHKTQMRPMVMPNGEIKARPMMYVALSYDHRIIDGREAVTFLVRIKEALEDPQRLILEV
ncbi:MAG TPA: 2-oxoglutarate dehydrogenase complex dihydrolipoyllysine-residue succinyltransferase [Alphaproteobacteria bacterium]|nr:2-oxoglutarate dehydrogenase complex dihydrolipoyllysine-residue succinyltransferase [Alphaproteobacteria bacterium]HNS44304.1 2-oxoglutarate dehydrogenase complex dihydrolipoyllysine-residue succinyltransferase [Alphaproteobacteria bacterium]